MIQTRRDTRVGRDESPKVSKFVSKAVGGFCAIFGLITSLEGVTATAVLGPFGVPILIFGILFAALGLYIVRAGRKKDKEEFAPSRPAARPTFSFRENDHQHIIPAWISADKQLEQLKTLLDAGLYTKEQYQEAKAKILRKR